MGGGGIFFGKKCSQSHIHSADFPAVVVADSIVVVCLMRRMCGCPTSRGSGPTSIRYTYLVSYIRNCYA